MLVHIHDNLMVSDLQERFSKCFPSLKIEFYTKSHSLIERSGDKDWISPSKNIGQIRQNLSEGALEIKSWYTVAKVEKDFSEKFGLNVQVFRSENGEWVSTCKTNKLTFVISEP